LHHKLTSITTASLVLQHGHRQKTTCGRSYLHAVITNDAEPTNAVLLGARLHGPRELLTSLWGWVFGKIVLWHAEAEAATDMYVPAVQKLVDEETDMTRVLCCTANGKRVCDTVVGAQTFAVDLEKMMCSCGLPKGLNKSDVTLSAVDRPWDWHGYIRAAWDTPTQCDLQNQHSS